MKVQLSSTLSRKLPRPRGLKDSAANRPRKSSEGWSCEDRAREYLEQVAGERQSGDRRLKWRLANSSELSSGQPCQTDPAQLQDGGALDA
jgi:hypothetical protein